MKKLIICAAALATALFAGSCQKENFEQAVGGNTVTYTVQLPDVATKAADHNRIIGDGKNVDQLIYEVWKTEKEGDDQLNPTNKTYLMFRKDAKLNENGVFSIELDLVNNQNYTILFWAQVENAGHYNTSDLSTADLKNVQIVSNTDAFDESRAAFFGVDFIKASEPRKSRQTKTLTRPFGQINLATTLKSKNDLGYELTVDKTTVTVARVASTFNVAAQKAVDSDQSYVFSVAAPDKNAETYEEKPITVNGTAYKWISMNYVFVPANQGLVDVKYTIATNHGPVYNKISNIPAQVNYKTNIVGNLLTSKTEYIVDLNNSWAGEYVHEVVTVTSAADLQEAINNAPEATGTAVNIKIDVEPNTQGEKILDLNEAFVGLMSTKAGETAQKNYGIQIPANKSIVLDLNGCTIKQELECTTGYAMIDNNGTLKIVGGGTLKFGDITTTLTKDPGYASNTIRNNGTLIVEDATIVNSSSENVATYGYPHCIDTNGELIINGGTLTNKTLYSTIRIWTSNNDPNKCKVTINGGTFNGSIDFQGHNNNYATIPHYGTLTINGGTFNATKDDSYAFRVLRMAVNVEDMDAIIKGGHFNGKVGVRNYSSSTDNPAVISIVGGTFRDDPSEFVVDGYPVNAPETEGGYYTIGKYTPVAKIGNIEYGSLRAAVAAVEDGGTITLVANETFTKANRYNNGGYWDGLGYSGDKNFTIDLGGYTIQQDGSLNDYLVWLKNDGTKANTITFKNGTMDAGTTAYCALCTANSHVNKLIVNLENITLINNKSNGSTVKIRAGSVLNVNAETKIIGKDSYLGIENWNAVVNIYDGAEIYMNGTTSYNGGLVGVGGNGTVNVYGGYGKGVSGGLIAMTSGGTINAMGGEWIANTDGTFANSNKSVLVAQSDKQYNAGAGNAVVNVTGGTYKGGYNCYGNAVGDAQINIKGGNFNADPANYVVAGYESTENAGTYTVDKPAALKELETALANGGNVTLNKDVTLLESIKVENTVVLDLNGKTITAPLFSAFEVKAGGELTVKNGKVVAYESTIRAIGGKAIIESGEYTSTGTALDSPATYRYSLDSAKVESLSSMAVHSSLTTV